MTSAKSPVRVQVYADLVCPWCRLGSHRFHRAVAASGVGAELVHLPYQLAPDAAGEPRPLLEVMGELFGPERAATMTAGMTELGAGEGVEYRFERALAAGTFTAHRLLWFTLREHGPSAQSALATSLYDLHFRDGGDLGDHAALADAAASAGVRDAKDFLASGEGVTEVRDALAAGRAAGVTSVPTFFVPGSEPLRGATEVPVLVTALRRAADVG
ncbi:DsbA family oxidoreductase [Nonomuraea rhizosphaerae]|uniref:DsbA family oxidoreductase n=1 Tax=Nonomuraea rhizosphaerae TaxID=2665663 RepID=UPI001C5CF49B|nr:DsbA family oxidoreductase [Nonomuraea rhizosphaerae]